MVSEVRGLIRQMSRENPLWGAPRIHGELLKIGIKVSQVTVGRYMPWRPKEPSPTWRSFLQNHATDIAATDMFVVATATFRILYAMIVLDHNRRRVIHFDVTGNPTQPDSRVKSPRLFPGTPPPLFAARPRHLVWPRLPRSCSSHGYRGGRYRTQFTLAKSVCRTLHRLDPSRMSRSVIIFNERHLRRVLASYFTIILNSEPICRSTRIARVLAPCRPALQAKSSRSRSWAVCIIATSVAPPDFVFAADRSTSARQVGSRHFSTAVLSHEFSHPPRPRICQNPAALLG